jgi:hypothetical protein
MKVGYITSSEKQTKHRMALFNPTNTPEIPHAGICGEVMLTLFWNNRGSLVEQYLEGATVTIATYFAILIKYLKPAIRLKCRGLFGSGVLLQNNNTWLHTAHATDVFIKDTSFECFFHPPHSPDLSPFGYHIVGPIKNATGGKNFRSKEEVQEAVHE